MLKGRKKFTPSEVESEVLEFWKQDKTFERSVKKPAPKGDFVFYDGPPFATGLPHYGHLLASAIKDAVPRYQTMLGKRVERRWGWDCHGLPIENIVEKDLKISGRKQIEQFGVEKFNAYARSKVLGYADQWKVTIERIGRWVDFDNSYKTMDNTYIESVWWVFKEFSKKGLVYESTKVLPYCPRCETPIAQSEIAMDNSYRELTDISVTVRAKLIGNTFGENVSILAWTTTPWTLPGNVALAINPTFEYVLIEVTDPQSNNTERVIVAKSRLAAIDRPHTTIRLIKGTDLVGMSYEPFFDYFHANKSLLNYEKGWKIYGADFVTDEDGTGVVHIAPAFGEDDMALAKKFDLPVIKHVTPEGVFTPEVKEFAGQKVKPKDDHQVTDIEIIKWLARAGKLFSKLKIVHAYPVCYRCETPLYYYAIPSWFIKIEPLKKRLLQLNEGINWVPGHLKEGRFKNNIKAAPDWNVSRNRFWASPLPIWKCKTCAEVKILGSLAEIKKEAGSANTYFTLRHGQSENNAANISSSDPKNTYHLTPKGKAQVEKSVRAFVKQLKGKKIDLIIASDLARTHETAQLAADILGYDKKKIVIDKRLREVQTGTFDGRPVKEYHDHFASFEEKFTKKPPKAQENLMDLKRRMTEVVYELEKKHHGRNILIVSHEYPIWMLFAGAAGATVAQTIAMRNGSDDFIKNAEVRQLDFSPIPHNADYELDLHRPYIDGFTCSCVCGGTMERIPEVLDAWFESGSMPYGQGHYPFENKKKFEKNYPAQFIAEYIAQTRTWFYYMHVISTALFDSIPFENVVTTGTVLAEDGQKMSKSKGNFPDPTILLDKYGADALRLYLLGAQIMRAEDLNFSEKGVDEIYKKVIMRLWNVYSFYDMYGQPQKTIARPKEVLSGVEGRPKGKLTELDKWMLGRLDELVAEVTTGMNAYELDRAVRPIGQFVDDLSTWYVRRSRRRFQKPDDKKDWEVASKTLAYVLLETSKVMAPFTPFFADALYKSLDTKKNASVHLTAWPKSATPAALKATKGSPERSRRANKKMGAMMAEVRNLASLALAKRASLGLKVRQPLASLTAQSNVAGLKANKELLAILADEVNVKKIIIKTAVEGIVEFDTHITPELLEEGIVRESVRMVQGLRQDAGYEPKDKIQLFVDSAVLGDVIRKHADLLEKEVGARAIVFAPGAEHLDAYSELVIDNDRIWFGIKKA